MGRYQKYRSYGHSRFTAASLAIPLPVILACAVVVGLICGLSGCSAPAYNPALSKDAAQSVLDNLVPACRDGVQYLISDHEAHKAAVPRMKLDGTLYRCSIKREKVRTVEEWEGL